MSDQPAGRAGIADLGWLAVFVLGPAAVAGAAAAYVVLWLAELLGPATAQAATITKASLSTERSSENGLIYHYDITADGPLDLVTRVDHELYPLVHAGDPVVLLRSALTGAITEVRTPIGQVSSVTGIGSVVLFVLSLLIVLAAAVGARSFLREFRRTGPLVACLAGIVAMGALHALPGGAHSATGEAVPDTAALLALPAAGATGGADGITVTLTGPPRPGLPDDAAPWVRDFPAYWITARLDLDVPDTAYLPMQLAGTGPGVPAVLPAAACSAAGFDGRVPRGATIPRDVVVCFAVSPGFTPRQLVVGGSDAPAHLGLAG